MPIKKHFPKLTALLAAAMTALCGCQGSSSQQTSQAESLPVQEVTGTFSVTAFNVGKADALVLQTDRENKLYIARTILDLESGYQDARLIAKPDESWLNPVTLK